MAFSKQVIDSGFTVATARRVIRWITRQRPSQLVEEFKAGRTTLLVTEDGKGELIEPTIVPETSRALRLLLSQMDLAKCCKRTLKRATELGLRLDREEDELGEQLGLEQKVTEKRTQQKK